ncbi:MAG: glutamine synthetase III [Inconstantimicrobium porci]|uniref:Glutamine synthetase type III n=1 Tax=Inconstantimicrobium porci TaxID=2652291 RepID=A0A7X2T166_9CLOT|nr:glutamine synthetase III [Inconstantimicrobium porci]MDD6772013.1 glutamine synthetase III [Inconstantimicrobium porci]MDY5913442.1 glutamine synthetase III [Inconstantimicrobium porci]MSR91351.1 glutamine synthetase type III [Inconstantimicrobium porci]
MDKLSNVFGENVFNDAVMRARLPKATYKALKKTIEEGKPLDLDTANVIAHEMKEWAVEKGATHFTHWFQPLTGVTAEKHDAFLNPMDDGTAILSFSGKELIQGEPDASSFPSGGLRATFEARGYTAWDCTSPAFVKDGSLCIPTAFCSYNGEALDSKTPLLRSMEVISKEAIRVLRVLGNTTAKKVIANVGPEQEYFIVDKKLYDQRKDLILTGRTLFGSMAPKGQELDDHYFGAIKNRISDYMKDLDTELWKLGISAKTKHNEVAPAQHELATIFTTTNIATDHNQLVMETMKKVALKHGLVCLLHEKPFAGINGSGKHNNWSINTDDGENLLNPGKTPQNNKQFLLFLSAIISAVDDYADLLRFSAANPGNDHRLGANEAPPAIVSIFLGDQLSEVVRQIVEDTDGNYLSSSKLKIGVSTLPDLPKDATDRNRTSPFAFTGNKFEFRMAPSSGSIAGPNTILNTTVADVLSKYADRLEAASDVDAEVDAIIKESLKAHHKVLFDGNGYSDEWVEEAAKRGLPNIKSTVEAIRSLVAPKNIEVMSKHGVLTDVEMHSRYEVHLENYIKTINIEALTALEMAKRDIIPAVIKYSTSLAESINAIKSTGFDADVTAQGETLTEISKLTASAMKKVKALESAISTACSKEDSYDQAYSYRYDVFEALNSLREDVDKLETLVDSKYWPMPTYTELLFHV